MFKGETLRGLLLTSYGFSIFGDRAGLAAQRLLRSSAVLMVRALDRRLRSTPVDRPRSDAASASRPRRSRRQPELVGV